MFLQGGWVSSLVALHTTQGDAIELWNGRKSEPRHRRFLIFVKTPLVQRSTADEATCLLQSCRQSSGASAHNTAYRIYTSSSIVKENSLLEKKSDCSSTATCFPFASGNAAGWFAYPNHRYICAVGGHHKCWANQSSYFTHVRPAS